MTAARGACQPAGEPLPEDARVLIPHLSCACMNGDFDGDHAVTPNDPGGVVALLTGV